jgi:hypothetical protein
VILIKFCPWNIIVFFFWLVIVFYWCAPKSLVRLKRVQLCQKAEVDGTWCRSQLPALKGVKGACWKFGIRLRRGTSYLVIWSCIQNQPTTWLELILHPFGVGTSHGQPWTHLTHHDPNSGEATTFPHIVFSTLLRGTRIRMTFIPRTPKEESRNCPGLDSRDFGSS